MNLDLGTWANAATALFTLAAAGAAWRAASVAKSAANDSGKSAKEQTDALLTAAKANALASRINFYTEQIRVLQRVQDTRPNQPIAELGQLKREQKHLAHWLDQQTNELGVGLGNECPGSEYNEVIKNQKKPEASKPGH